MDWTILRSGHDKDHTTLLQACGTELDCWGGIGCSALGSDLPDGVCCALSHWNQCPSSRMQQTTVGGIVVLWGWHGAWGNLKEKKQLEMGSPRLENFPVLPTPLLRRNLAVVVRWDGRMFPWQPEKAIPKVVIHPSPLGSSLDQRVRGACYGI